MSTHIWTILKVSVALISFARPISAQWSASPALALGIAIPTGALGRAVQEGVAVKAGLWMRAPRVPVGFTLEGMYTQFGDAADAAANGRVRLSAITANMTSRRHERRLDLYGVAGGGWYWVHGSPVAYASRQVPGINVGLGEVVALGAADYFVELRLHLLRKPSRDAAWTTFMPLVLGVRF